MFLSASTSQMQKLRLSEEKMIFAFKRIMAQLKTKTLKTKFLTQ
jgi:hypothetical protein